MTRELPFLDQPRRLPAWLIPFLCGLLLGACVVELVRADAELGRRGQAEPVSDAYQFAEPTEAVLWAVDVDGESAP